MATSDVPEVNSSSPPQPLLVSGNIEQIFWCLFYAAGIIGTLLIYGILQERIMTIDYGHGDTAALFTYSVFCIFINRVFAVVYSIVMCLYNQEGLRNKAPLWAYLTISLSNVYASTCQYEALKYVTFAVQQLGKSFKMMPVMIWGMLISDKRYKVMDWIIAAFVTGGVTEFLLTGPVSENHHGHSNELRGFLFLALFLALDGITSTMQEKLFKDYKTSKYNQMLYVNGVSSIVSLITLLATSTLVPAFRFACVHPRLWGDLTALALSQVSSQWFIYSQVKEFGALVFAATMNVRQVISIIVSYVTYNHHITGLQVIGLVVAFGALFYKSYLGLTATSAPTKEEQEPLVPTNAAAPAAGNPEKMA